MTGEPKKPTVDERLASERNVWLSTVRPDGRPHTSPVWFVYLNGRFWIGTGSGAVKSANVTANDQVTVALEDGNAPVLAEGTVTVHETERPADVAAAFKAKFDWDITIAEDEDIAGKVVLWEITPTKWLFAAPSEALGATP